MSFDLERFKQSNVARIFVAYAVVVFASMQIFDYLLPIIEAPLWVAQTLTLILFLGFPISLLIGWATQRPPTESSLDDASKNLGSTVPRQKIIIIGLASSVLFGFLGLVLMPYLLDQAAYSPGIDSEATISQMPIRRGIRTDLNLGFTGVHPFWGYRTRLALSPNGTQLVYLEQNQTGGDLMVRDLLTTDEPRVLFSYSRSAAYVGFFEFSSDGEWVIVKRDSSLFRVRIEGGAAQQITEGAYNAGFYATDTHVYFTDQGTGDLVKVDLGGNGPREVIATAYDEYFFWPQLLPNGTHMLVTAADSPNGTATTGRIQLINLQSLERETLIETAFNGRFAESGHIVFSRDASVWAVPFDLAELDLAGEQAPVLLGVETDQRRGVANYAFSEDGRLVYLRGSSLNLQSGALLLTRFARDGNLIPADIEAQQFGHIALSPNERQVALTLYENSATSDIWVWDLNRDILGRRTFGGNASRPVWSLDGRNIIYRVYDIENPDNGGIWTIAANGGSQPSSIFSSKELVWPWTIDSEGQLLFTMNSGPRGVYSLNLSQKQLGDLPEAQQQASSIEIMPQNPTEYVSPSISPNGSWLAYVSAETGVNQVYVRPYPAVDAGKWQASVGGGIAPVWNTEENELFYHYAGSQFSVKYSEQDFNSEGMPTYIEFDRPIESTQIPLRHGLSLNPSWVYSGQRDEFIGITDPGSVVNQEVDLEKLLEEQISLVVIEDWFSELKSLVPKSID
ncbi:MAG: hypothetical protein VYD09_01375 [Chloroflexota bacterium]|nr:hypothetical protein [Chloroflexota bacterium]